MTGDTWGRVKEVFQSALELPKEHRPEYLNKACAGDARLRAEVESLLDAGEAAGGFIEEPALSVSRELADDEPDRNIGRRIGPYLITRLIGHGGMGAVYYATRDDQEFRQAVAVKMIRRGMDSQFVIRRFRNERQILASLDHPNIARLFDGGTTDDGLPYFVMEYVDGTAIDTYADAHTLTTHDRLKLCLEIFRAVEYAHEHRIVHRDIKPSNILVTADRRPKLLDFGIAKILQPDLSESPESTMTSQARPMTPDYASPEQIRGQSVTAASDIYALGILLYELLTGHRPYRFRTRTPDEMERVVCEQEPERPSTAISRIEEMPSKDGTTTTRTTPHEISRTREGTPEALRRRLAGALDNIILKALRKEPSERYSSVTAFREDVQRYLDDMPVLAGKGALRYRLSRFQRRHKRALLVAVAFILAVGLTALTVSRINRVSEIGSERQNVGDGATQALRPSLAVLGFRNLSQRAEEQWLSTALTEMLTTELAADGQVRVVPPDVVARARLDLELNDQDTLAGEELDRARSSLGADYVVVGSYMVGQGGASRPVRLDLRVQRGGEAEAIALAGSGTESDLFAVVSETGRGLRTRMGLQQSEPETVRRAGAAYPQTPQGSRLYAEGLRRLRMLDALAARDLLLRAAEAEPNNALIQSAVAAAWTSLGYDTRAADAAKRSFELASSLPREERLAIEGRYYEALKDWPKAVEAYRALWGFFSDNVEYGLRLASAQTSGGQAQDAIRTVEALRRLPKPIADDPRIDLVAGQAAGSLSDFKSELDSYRRTAEKAKKLGARSLVARARLGEGRSHFNQGQPQPALKALEEAQAEFKKAGDRAGAAVALNSLAAVLNDQRDITLAKRMFEESLATSREIGDKRSMSSALNNLGVLYKDQGQFVEARKAHEESLALRRDIGDKNWTAISLSNIGVVLFEQDHFDEAAKYYQESLDLAREIGDRRGIVRALHNLSIVKRELGDLGEARKGYEESIAIREQIGDKRGGAIGRVELGRVLFSLGDFRNAKRTLEDGLRLARETRLRPGEAQILYQLAELDLADGNIGAARKKHEESLQLRRDMKEDRTIIESRIALAAVALEEGRAADAERQASAVITDLRQQNARPAQLMAEVVRSHALLAQGNVAEARRSLNALGAPSDKTRRSEITIQWELVSARIDAAQGRIDDAIQRLRALQGGLEASGLKYLQLQARLAAGEIELRAGRPEARTRLMALERDARSAGTGLIVQKVRSVLR